MEGGSFERNLPWEFNFRGRTRLIDNGLTTTFSFWIHVKIKTASTYECTSPALCVVEHIEHARHVYNALPRSHGSHFELHQWHNKERWVSTEA